MNIKGNNTSGILAEQISEKMIEYISVKNLQPGEKLGTEMDMAQMLGVSRSTIREAIRILVSRQILEVRQGSGTYITSQTGIAKDPLGFGQIHDRFRLTWDLQEIRMLIEPEIASWAAIHITEEQLKELEDLCAAAEKMSDENRIRLQEDIRFHTCIAKASCNLAAPNLIPIIEKAVELFAHYTDREAASETIAPHLEILEGLRRHDPQWTKDMMVMHLAFNRQELRRVAMERGEVFETSV